MEKPIPIKTYEPRILNNTIHYFAIPKFGAPIEMPPVYSDMYDDEHLMIVKRHLDQPELFGVEEDHYIPLYTGDNHD